MKKFFYKIFDSGGKYLTTWKKDVIDKPIFTWHLNGGQGQLTITLARKTSDFGEGMDVNFSNKVECWIKDKESGDKGKKIWSGWISGYELQEGEKEQKIIVTCQSYATSLASRLLATAAGATTIAYNSYDPAAILRNILTLADTEITYSSESISDTGTTVSYTFVAQKVIEAIEKCLELCPAFYYWYIDADNILWLKKANFDVSDHQLILGKHIKSFTCFKNIEDTYNCLYFLGGGEPALYKKYERTGSIAEYGRREYFMKDERVTLESTANILAQNFLDGHDYPQVKVEVEVLDSNVAGKDRGYDIESFEPGQTVIIRHPRYEAHESLWDVAEWDADFWDENIKYVLNIPMQIQTINYAYHSASLELAYKRDDVAKRIEDIYRNLEQYRASFAPSSPS